MVAKLRLADSPNFLQQGLATARVIKGSQVVTIMAVTVSGEGGRDCGRGQG